MTKTDLEGQAPPHYYPSPVMDSVRLKSEMNFDSLNTSTTESSHEDSELLSDSLTPTLSPIPTQCNSPSNVDPAKNSADLNGMVSRETAASTPVELATSFEDNNISGRKRKGNSLSCGNSAKAVKADLSSSAESNSLEGQIQNFAPSFVTTNGSLRASCNPMLAHIDARMSNIPEDLKIKLEDKYLSPLLEEIYRYYREKQKGGN